MANTAYCLYCFEILAARLEKHDFLTLKQVEDLWEKFKLSTGVDQGPGEDEDDMTEDDEEQVGDGGGKALAQPVAASLRSRDVSRLQAPSPASGSSSAPSTPSTGSSVALGEASKSSSRSSLFSFSRKSQDSPVEKEEKHPLFVTWNTISSRGYKSLRGCVGTFEAQELSSGLRSYALTSALDDVRFSPISASELPSLSNSITLLMDFDPCADPLDWDLGTHGLRISFTHHGKRYGATYLPDVAPEQGWTKEETVISLMRKAGWSGRSGDWKKVADLKCVKYQGMEAHIDYKTWREWRSWVESNGLDHER